MSTRNLKDKLSSYLHRVEMGERILVLRDGEPVAALVPMADVPADDERSALGLLAARGLVVLPEQPGPLRGPVASGGASASEMVLEDRR